MKFHSLLYVTSIGLYLVSLVLPSYYTSSTLPDSFEPGWGALFVGWMGIFVGIVAWFANPAVFISWILFQLNKVTGSLISVLIAIALSATCFSIDSYPLVEGGRVEIVRWGSGFWLWIASQVTIAIACITLLCQNHRRAKNTVNRQQSQ